MTWETERKTPRTDSQRLTHMRYAGLVADPNGDVVLVDFAERLEVETQELAEALELLKEEALRFLHGCNCQECDIAANYVARAALARHRANQPQP